MASALAMVLGLALISVLMVCRRTRRRCNRAMHELRRPLQIAALRGTGEPVELELIADALDRLDAVINRSRSSEGVLETVDLSGLAADAARRWRHVGSVEAVSCGAGRSIRGDRRRLAAALDNLIANALEHGGGPVLVSADESSAGHPRLLIRNDPRRGHGLRIVEDIVAEHGGRLEIDREAAGRATAVDLPSAA